MGVVADFVQRVHGIDTAAAHIVRVLDFNERCRRIVLAESKRPLSPDEQADAARMVDRQLERAVTSLRSVRIYNERQAALNDPKFTQGLSPDEQSMLRDLNSLRNPPPQ